MVRCVDCGFLTRRNTTTGQLEEIWRGPDDNIEVFGPVGREVIRLRDAPICFARACNLGSEYQGPTMYVDSYTDPRINMVILKERECTSFTEWQQGFTPKEHREMMDRKWLLNWQAEREEVDRKWRQEQERCRERQEWYRYIFLAVFTLLAAAFGAGITYWMTK